MGLGQIGPKGGIPPAGLLASRRSVLSGPVLSWRFNMKPIRTKRGYAYAYLVRAKKLKNGVGQGCPQCTHSASFLQESNALLVAARERAKAGKWLSLVNKPIPARPRAIHHKGARGHGRTAERVQRRSLGAESSVCRSAIHRRTNNCVRGKAVHLATCCFFFILIRFRLSTPPY